MRAHRLIVAAVFAAAAFAAGAAPAVAAPPEAPELSVELPVHATSATLLGVLNPKGPGELGSSYTFLYRASTTKECKGGSETIPGLSTGLEHEVLPAEPVTGLLADTEYAVCLLVENAANTERTASAPITFKTALPPETPETLTAEPIATTATLHGVLNPKGAGDPGSYEFLYRESQGECQGAGGKATPVQPANGEEGEPATAELTELLPNATYSFCLLARNEAEETAVGPPVAFTTLSVKPTLGAESTTNVTATSAVLTATINPNGAATTYRMEYGTSTAYGSSTPAVAVGSGRAAVPASQPLAGLSADTTYHWRLLATNAGGPVSGPDHTFVYLTPGPALPDNRAYELVTPAQKNGALIGELFLRNVPPQIEASGQRVIAPSLQCFAGPETCVAARSSEGEPYEFTRTASGWVTHPLAPPASFETNSWSSVNADAGTTLFDIPNAPQSPVDDFFARDGQGALDDIGPIGEHANYASLEQEGVLATADLSHVLYETAGPVWSFDQTTELRALYEYAGAGNAAPLMVGVSGGRGSHELISICQTSMGGARGTQRRDGSLSEDGRTVYFAAEGRNSSSCQGHSTPATAPPVRELYARIDGERQDARSLLISGPTPQACGSSECKANTTEEASARDANFLAASADGSRVVFSDTQQLTDGASEDPNAESSAAASCNAILEPGGCNLYESQCPNGNRCAQPAERRLIDLSEGVGGAPVPGGPRVQGLLALSGDGSHVYFIARGVLSGGEENHNHERAEDEKDNLYAYSDGQLVFVARLSPSDEPQWESGSLTANVTPDGRLLVFTSHRALTADDTREEGPAQVFEYDAQAKALRRISIGAGGFNDNGNHGVLGELLPHGENAGDASIARASRVIEAASVPVRSDPTMSHNGAFVFFQSPVALTPQALDDVAVGRRRFAQNVYEYHEGHVSLISDGKDTTSKSRLEISPVELLGSDASGANVFFATFDQLVAEDTDTQRDYYDAHICGEEPCPPPRPAPPVPCEGEACHGGAPGAPGGQAPSSESFNGPGNLAPSAPAPPKPKTAAQIRAERLAKALRACRKKKMKKAKRAKCERKARKQFGSAKKANRAKRAGSRRSARP